MATTTLKKTTSVSQLETFKSNKAEGTYGASFPLYAQWSGSDLILKCDQGGTSYRVLVDDVIDPKVYYYISAYGIKIDPTDPKMSENGVATVEIDVSDAVPDEKNIRGALVWISSYTNDYYSLPYIESGEVKTWIHGTSSAAGWNKIRIKSTVLWSSCTIYAIIFV